MRPFMLSHKRSQMYCTIDIFKKISFLLVLEHLLNIIWVITTLRAEEKEIDSNRETLNPEITNPFKYRHTLGHTPQKLKMLKILLDDF